MRKTLAGMAAMFIAGAACAATSASYVQRGLIAQWDGIDNAGTGVHDPNATVWKDLKGNLDMTLTSKGRWMPRGNSLFVSGLGAQGASARLQDHRGRLPDGQGRRAPAVRERARVADRRLRSGGGHSQEALFRRSRFDQMHRLVA